jgi:hypothetical protein
VNGGGCEDCEYPGVGGAGWGEGKLAMGVFGAGTLGYTAPSDDPGWRPLGDDKLATLDCRMDPVRVPELELDAVTGDDLTGEDRGELSESELSGLATKRPCTWPRRRALCGFRKLDCGVDGPDAGPVETDRRGGPDIALTVSHMARWSTVGVGQETESVTRIS